MNIKQLENENLQLINNNLRFNKKIKKYQFYLARKGKYLPLDTLWLLKDKIKDLQRKILINDQQVQFNLLKKINYRQIQLQSD